ncbi:MAG: cytidylyltransferase domain-containing protein [Promethearchaeota archaeon]
MRILGTVCVRGGSKGLKNKNFRLINGKPLLSYTFKAFKAWGRADRIICSTDSLELQKIARKYGAETPFLRPAELATDEMAKLDVLRHALKFCENEEKKRYDYLIDLDATSPLRTIKDIETSFNRLENSDADLITSAYLAERNPYFNMVELDENGYAVLCKIPEKPIVARQQAPLVYSLNASIWVFKRNYLLETSYVLSGKTLIYEMPDTSIDIDRQIDIDFIEFMIREEKFNFDF